MIDIKTMAKTNLETVKVKIRNHIGDLGPVNWNIPKSHKGTRSDLDKKKNKSPKC